MFLKNLFKKIVTKRKTITNISYYFTASMVGALMNLVLNPFLALYLKHEDYAIIGYYGAFNSLLMPIITFSLVSYYSRNFFLLSSEMRERLKNTLIITILFFSALISFFSLVGLYIFYKVNSVTLPFFPYAMLSIASVFMNGFYTFLLVELKMQRNAKKYFKISFAHSIVAALLAILFVIIFKWGAYGKMLGTAFSALIFALFSFWVLLDRWEFDKIFLYKALGFSWPITLAAMLNYFFSGVDRAMLEGLNNIKLFGLYNIAAQIAGYLALFSTSLNDTFQPDILESIAKKNKKKTFKIIAGILCFNLIPIFIFIIFAPLIIKILTYNRFTDAFVFARILSLKNITSGLYFALSSVLIGYGFTKFTLINKIISTCLSLLMFRYLINNYGFYGAAWGQVFSFLILSVFAFLFILYYLKKNEY